MKKASLAFILASYFLLASCALWSRVFPPDSVIEFHPNGGIGPQATMGLKPGESCELLPNPYTRDGYDFTGWGTSPNGAVVYPDCATFTAGMEGVVLYAIWRPRPYLLHFDPNGGEGSMEDQIILYETTAVLHANAFTRRGYEFGGWSREALKAPAFPDQASFPMSKKGDTVYAVWRCARWARTPASPSVSTSFTSLAVDAEGNSYAAGYVETSTSIDFGDDVILSGAGSSFNAIIVKFGSDGTALWARTPSVDSGTSIFSGVALDSSGNVFAVGYQAGTETYSYGTGIEASGTGNVNPVVVKYDPDGVALWARSISAGTGTASFHAVACAADGAVYAAGFQGACGSITYAPGVTQTSAFSAGSNAVLVKYDSDGTVLWVRGATSGTADSDFTAVAVDADGNVYAAGSQWTTAAFDYDSGLIASGPSSGSNAVLVKYSSQGLAQWCAAPVSGACETSFTAVLADGAGGVFLAGSQEGTETCVYGTGVEATSPFEAPNGVLLQYDGDGTAQWARSYFSGVPAHLNSLALADDGAIYAAGSLRGVSPFYGYVDDFGEAVRANAQSGILVKCAADGTPVFFRGTSGESYFEGMALNGEGEILCAGWQSRCGVWYDQMVGTPYMDAIYNAVLAKYMP